MASADLISALTALLREDPLAAALTAETRQELLIKGAVAMLEELASQTVPPASFESSPGPMRLLQETAALQRDATVRHQALQVLLRLAEHQHPAAVDALYQLAVEEDSLAARQAIETHAWHPQSPGLRFLFDWFSHLTTKDGFPSANLEGLTQAFFEVAPPTLQRRLLATAAANQAENWAMIVSAFQRGTREALLPIVDRYPVLRTEERAILLKLLDQHDEEGFEAVRALLAALFLAYDDPSVRALLRDHRFLPEDPEQKALLYFLMGDWDAYENLDFDHHFLLNAYAQASKSLRRRLLEHARHSGQIEWLREAGIASATGETRWISDLTDADWETSLLSLKASQNFEALWRLAQAAPPLWSARILDALAKESWQPSAEADRDGFSILTSLAQAALKQGLSVPLGKKIITNQNGLTCLALHPSETILAAGGSAQQIEQWNLPEDSTHLPPLIGPVAVTRSLVYSPDGDYLAAAAADNRIRVFRLESGQVIKTMEGHRAQIRSLVMHPDGRTLYSAGFDETIRFWRFPHGSLQKTIQPGAGEIFALACSADGQHILSGGADRLIRVWALPDGIATRVLTGHTDTITHLATGASNDLVASASRDGTLRVWNMHSGGLVCQIRHADAPVTSLAFHPNEQVVLSGHQNGAIHLWNLSTGRQMETLPGLQQPIIGLVLADGGNMCCSAESGSMGVLKIWDLHTLFQVSLTTHRSTNISPQPCAEEVLSTGEKAWLTFLEELARWRKRFDIELMDFRPISIGEFDIEL